MKIRPDFKTRYGPWALVTGAAHGLGAEFGSQIAALGLNLVLVDILAEELAGTARRIELASGQDIKPIVADLSQPDFMEIVRQEIGGLEIGLLICNAATGTLGAFFDTGIEAKLETVEVNVRAPLLLVHEFGGMMKARSRGGIILLSSASALQGSVLVANYAATKAYNLILAEGLWEELRHEGIDVLGLMPGPTSTPGYLSTNPDLKRVPILKVMDASEAVAEALGALGKRPSHIPGRTNRCNAFLTTRLLSRKRATTLVGKTMRTIYGQ